MRPYVRSRWVFGTAPPRRNGHRGRLRGKCNEQKRAHCHAPLRAKPLGVRNGPTPAKRPPG